MREVWEDGPAFQEIISRQASLTQQREMIEAARKVRVPSHITIYIVYDVVTLPAPRLLPYLILEARPRSCDVSSAARVHGFPNNPYLVIITCYSFEINIIILVLIFINVY